MSRVYRVLVVESEEKQICYGEWVLCGWDCEEGYLYFSNPYDGELHVPMQNTETGEPKAPWVIELTEKRGVLNFKPSNSPEDDDEDND